MTIAKRYKKTTEGLDRNKSYTVEEAVKLIKSRATAKFDETIELSMNLGVDPKHADQMVRGVVSLPSGTGRKLRVAVFAKGAKAEEAKKAGADLVGAEELAEQVNKGVIDFDRCIATPDMMGVVGRLGKVLGPRNLMPNPKVGTVTMDVTQAIKDAKGGVVSSDEKGELVKERGSVDYTNRAEFGEMMRTDANLTDPAADKERFRASRGFANRIKEILGDSPDIVFEHVGRATFPTSVYVVKPFGKVVICGATSGFQLDFDVRYLWMRQKQIIGSHFANAYECMRANQLMAEGKVRPVLWQTMEFDGVPHAHQLMHENKHLGKTAILVGAESEDAGKNEEGPGAIRAEVGA